MSELNISYAPPTGYPLGTNRAFKFWTKVLIPIMNLIVRHEWRGQENIPKSGPVIVASNHVSYLDVLVLTHYLWRAGRAPRYLGKEGVFKVPVVGRVLLAAGQVPVKRESADARKALHHAIELLKAGHCIGGYPEGTLTRDPNGWPMIAKTGFARLAIVTQTPIVPIAQWGIHEVMPTYEITFKIFPRKTTRLVAGKPLDFSRWYGREDDPEALREATAYLMDALTTMVEELRGEKRPAEVFDPHNSDLPRTGNFKKKKR